MKNLSKVKWTLLFAIIIATSCKKESSILYASVAEDLVLIRDVETLKESDDQVSNHVDSILVGSINSDVVSTGLRRIDLNLDHVADIAFEIIDLNKFNPENLPESFDTLAARAHCLTFEILDNSTYGYYDALNKGDEVSEAGSWDNSIGVLGTFMGAGNFNGKGERFLGIRIPTGKDYNYGWIMINCSAHNDDIKIIDWAYNEKKNEKILAGQKE